MSIIILDISITKYIRSIRFFLYTQYTYTGCRVTSPSPKLAVSESGFATRTDYHLVLQLGEMRIRRQYFVEYKFCENKMMWSSDNKCGSWCKHHCDTWYEFLTFIFLKSYDQADLARFLFFVDSNCPKNVKTKSKGWLPESASSRDSEGGHFRGNVL